MSLLLLIGLLGCYQTPKIEGFDSEKWMRSLDVCDDYRSESTKLLIKMKSELLSKNQNEIRAFLGNASRHQLFDRNQKFFFYQLDCKNNKELSVRFDALGRVKEMQIIFIQ